MGYLIGLIIVIVVAGFVLQAVLTVAGYILMIALYGAMAVGLVYTIVEFVSAAFAGFARSATTENLRIEPPPATDDGPDPVYRGYYSGPVLSDYRDVMVRAIRRVFVKILFGERGPIPQRPLVPQIWSLLYRSDSLWWRVPVFLPIVLTIVGVTAGAVGGVALLTVTSVVFLVLLVLLVLGTLATAGASRLVEFGLLSLRGITIECRSCHDRATRPVYRCPTCSARHRQLVPGLAGVTRRTCSCLTTLPTLLAFGKAKLVAQCANCGTQLPVKGLTAPTFHIPVIAGPAAGKSIFMHTAVTRLLIRGTDDGFEFADVQAKHEFERNKTLGVLDDPKRITKTRALRPHAYNVYVGKEKSAQRRLLYLYDPAGESVESADQLADSQFLRHAKGIVFIIDPFSLRAVRAATDRTLLREVSASASDVRSVMERFVETLRERDVTKRSTRLDLRVAVVITKADALRDPSTVRHPYTVLDQAATDQALRTERDAAVREWLKDVGSCGDLVASLANNFTAISYFVVSFEDAVQVAAHTTQRTAVANDDPAAPLLWLLSGKAAK